MSLSEQYDQCTEQWSTGLGTHTHTHNRNTNILTPGHFVGNSDSYYTHSWVSCPCWSAWSITNPWWLLPLKKGQTWARRQGRADNDKHPSWSARGTKGGQETAGPIIHCDVGSVISCCSSSSSTLMERSEKERYFFSPKSLRGGNKSVFHSVLVWWTVITAWCHYQ